MMQRYPQMPTQIPGTDFLLEVIERKGAPQLLTDRETKQRRGLLAKIHIAKQQMRLNEGEYEMILRSFAVATAADMTIDQLEKMVKLLKHYGWKEIKRPHKGASEERLVALRGRCVQAARELQNGDKRLIGLAEKICGTSQLVWCQSSVKLERLLAVLGKIKKDDESHPYPAPPEG
ncbi:MAG: regulatory protein GemA [Deltaproteobacteria bacterium]|nr:regulatory protein GemA [Deltaproteobacteria bacterium]